MNKDKIFDYNMKYFPNDLIQINKNSKSSFGVILFRFANEHYKIMTGQGIEYLYRHDFHKI